VYAQENWLPNTQIRGLISKLKATHVCLITDACFSGDILNSTRSISPTIDNEYFRKAYERTSRQVLTSGASETVPDRSEFCRLLKMALEKNKNAYLDPVMLFNEIRLGVRKTIPMIGNLKETGHQDGASFLLFLKVGEEDKIVKREESKTVMPEKPEISVDEDASTTAIITEPEKRQRQEEVFKVLAGKKWQDTGITISAGDRIIIEYVSGKWTDWSGNPYVDADGYKYGAPLNGFTGGALIGRIGEDEPFQVGNYCEIKQAKKSGKLYLRMNESDGVLFDSLGAIKMRIKVNK
jgi:hypothetical protein